MKKIRDDEKFRLMVELLYTYSRKRIASLKLFLNTMLIEKKYVHIAGHNENLFENKKEETRKDLDATGMINIIIRLHKDEDFYELVNMLQEFESNLITTP